MDEALVRGTSGWGPAEARPSGMKMGRVGVGVKGGGGYVGDEHDYIFLD